VIEIGLALALFGVFLDRGQIDRLQTRDLLAELQRLRTPLHGVGVLRQFGEHDFRLQSGGEDGFGELGGAQFQRLRGQPLLRLFLAQRGQTLLDLMALLIQLAQRLITGFQRTAGIDQLAIHQQALIETSLAFGLQIGGRCRTGGQLRGDVAAARMNLAELGIHARERLFQRSQRGAL